MAFFPLGVDPVKRRDRVRRFGLVLAYAVITVWAQAGDRHGHETPIQPQCDAACRDPRPHFSGHAAPDLEHVPSDCPACQLRSNLHVTAPTIPALGGQIVERIDLTDPIAATPRVLGLPNCRAPPLA